MKIDRRGSQKNHGMSSTELKAHEVKWEPTDKSVHYKAWYVPDFNTSSSHDWDVSISLVELRSMIDAVAKGMSEVDAVQIGAAMAQSLTAIVKIAAVAAHHQETSRRALDAGAVSST